MAKFTAATTLPESAEWDVAMPESTTATPMPLPFTAGCSQQRAEQSAATARARKVRSHGAVGHGHGRTDDVVERDGCDAGNILQHVEQTRSGFDHDEAVEHSKHLDAVALGRGLNRRDIAAHDRADRTIVAVDDKLQQVGGQQIARPTAGATC